MYPLSGLVAPGKQGCENHAWGLPVAGRHAMSTGETVDQAVQLCGKSGEVPLQAETKRRRKFDSLSLSLTHSLFFFLSLSLVLFYFQNVGTSATNAISGCEHAQSARKQKRLNNNVWTLWSERPPSRPRTGEGQPPQQMPTQ